MRKPDTTSQLWKRINRESQILRMPKRSIATFGPTHLPYCCLSPVGEKSTRLRWGTVLAEKPKIYLLGELQELFEGFDAETRRAAREMLDQIGDRLRALGYTFRHEPKGSKLSRKPFEESLNQISTQLEKDPAAAVLRGPDSHWELSLLKFTVDLALKSVKGNVTELQERGFFDPDQRLKHQVEALFYQASKSRERIPALAEFLKDNNLFEEYEDRFFSLAAR